MNSKAKEVINVIMSRKSVRKFTDQIVPKNILELILKAGMAAPSASNRQPWAFIIITDRAILNKLADELPYAKMCYTASAAIVVCGVPEDILTDKENAYWVQDCSAATENILLAVKALELGAVWTACYPYESRIKPVREILGIPENIIPLNVIPIGYPAEENLPKNKFKNERIHWQNW